MKLRFFLILVLLAVCLPHVSAAGLTDSIVAGWRHSLSLDVRPSYAFNSYRDDILSKILDLDNAKNTRLATSVHLQYGFSFPSNSRQGRICSQAWQGIGTAVNFMGNPKGLGTPVSIYAFQGAPVWSLTDRLSVYYEWNFGVSFGWRPCDGYMGASNLIVGSRVNAYINLGGGLRWRLNDTYSLMAGLNLTHYSNGNTSFPNPGVNLAGLRLGIVRYMGRQDMGRRFSTADGSTDSNFTERSFNPRRPEFDLTLYGALRKRVYRGGETPVLLSGRFAVAGLDIAPMWRVTRNFRTGPSLDLQWDESTDLKRHHVSGDTSEDIRFTRPPFLRQVCVGLSGRAELVMPIFSVNVGLGYNVFGPEETRATYQLANLKIRLTDALYINIGYQLLDFQKQNNLMLGVGYTIR
ncbi:MAG: acyloxyacyl hydrolase, partial [Muribaculaceae bacterium]|nr:acyloxyacyl hydrolase [Muribaculaceae bacterium]